MIFRELESLSSLNTLKLGGVARYFFEVSGLEDLKKAVSFSKEKNLKLFILGGGSNTFFATDIFDGVIIRINIKGVDFFNGEYNIYAEIKAGEEWDEFVKQCVDKNLWGVENLSLIPGSVGGAPIQNIGAYGAELKDVLESVEVFDTETFKIKSLSNKECRFGYRTSIFKEKEGARLIVIGIKIKLNPIGKPNLSYKDLDNYFKGVKNTPSLGEVREAVIKIRTEKLPNLSQIGTAGSFFKNPIIPIENYNKLLRKFPDLPGVFLDNERVKVPAGFLLDKIGNFKGFKVGGAKVWDKQALVLVNKGSATKEDMVSLYKIMQKKVFEETNIFLENEVVIVN